MEINFNKKRSILVLVAILLFISALLYYSTIQLFPSFIHAWTQSDRYAIALRFLDNGFDIFHPATFNLQTVNGITRVDFPINEFIVALIMKILGTTSPAVFRLYTLFISIVGLVYLYLFSKRITGSGIKAWLIVLFVFLSPVYVYYQAGFIPSIPAIACVFIAYYYFFSYKESPNNKQLGIAVLFFLLAALIRLPFVIFLFAAVLQQVWLFFKGGKFKGSAVLFFLIAFVLFGAYYFYNIHLARLYGNMFLDNLMPAKSGAEFKEILVEMYHHWFLQYFTLWHYFLLLFVIAVSFISFYKRKSFLEENKKYWFHLLIVACGAIIYFLLMARQYYAHDYYFLDSLFVPVVLLFIFSLKNVSIETANQKMIWSICTLLIGILFFMRTQKIETERYITGPWDRTEITRLNFIGAEKYLDSLSIPKDAKILVIDAYTTNAPLILMNRKGYTVMGTTKKNILTSLFWSKWDYVVIQDAFLVSDVIKGYPFITSMLERVNGNGKISLYKKSDKIQSKSLQQFLGISPNSIYYETQINFDSTLTDTHIRKAENVSSIDNNSVAKLDSTIEYGTTLVLKANELKKESNLKVLVNGDFLGTKKLDGIQLVVAITNAKGTVSYQSFALSDYIKPSSKWQKLEFQFVLPAFETPDDELAVYLWNSAKTSLFYDNLNVIIYK